LRGQEGNVPSITTHKTSIEPGLLHAVEIFGEGVTERPNKGRKDSRRGLASAPGAGSGQLIKEAYLHCRRGVAGNLGAHGGEHEKEKKG